MQATPDADGDTKAACKLHVAISRPGINLNFKSHAENVLTALKEDIADGNQAAVNECAS